MMAKRSVILDAATVVKLRKKQGWVQEDIEWKSQDTVRRLAAEERAAGVRFGEFSRYLQRRQSLRSSCGIGKGVITKAENGRPISVISAKILAATLGVELSKLLRVDVKEPIGLDGPEALDVLLERTESEDPKVIEMTRRIAGLIGPEDTRSPDSEHERNEPEDPKVLEMARRIHGRPAIEVARFIVYLMDNPPPAQHV